MDNTPFRPPTRIVHLVAFDRGRIPVVRLRLECRSCWKKYHHWAHPWWVVGTLRGSCVEGGRAAASQSRMSANTLRDIRHLVQHDAQTTLQCGDVDLTERSANAKGCQGGWTLNVNIVPSLAMTISRIFWTHEEALSTDGHLDNPRPSAPRCLHSMSSSERSPPRHRTGHCSAHSTKCSYSPSVRIAPLQ